MLILRIPNGNPLTNQQVDNNFSNLYGYSNIIQSQVYLNTNPTLPYTLALTDGGRTIYITSAAGNVQIPANGTVSFNSGTVVTIINNTTGTANINILSDTLKLANSTKNGNLALSANGMATCIKVASTTWFASGAGLS